MTEPTAEASIADADITVDVLMGPTDLEDALRADVAKGLVASPKELPPKWFYDDHGCELFDQITRLPEYYPTEAERSILRAEADAIVERSGADTVVELGSGTSDKTRVLLDAFAAGRSAAPVLPVRDQRDHAAAAAADRSAASTRASAVHAVVGDFERHLGQLPQGGRRMVAFLGSTIGNFAPAERAALLHRPGRRPASGRQPPARHRPGEGRRPARGRLRRRRRRDRRSSTSTCCG